MTETFHKIESSRFNECVQLNNYHGAISLVAAREGKDGKVYMQWCYPQFNDKPLDKSLPWKVPLGTRDEAVTILKALLAELEGTVPATPAHTPAPAWEDEPPLPVDHFPF